MPNDLTLVLDDYHLADTPEVSDSVSFLLDHRPPQLHLVISARAWRTLLAVLQAAWARRAGRDPSLDLRFTAEEAGGYLNTVHGLGLSTHDVEAREWPLAVEDTLTCTLPRFTSPAHLGLPALRSLPSPRKQGNSSHHGAALVRQHGRDAGGDPKHLRPIR